MLRKLIQEASMSANADAIVTPQGSTSWRELRAMTESFSDKCDALRRSRVGLSFPAAASSWALLAALEK